MATVEAVSSHPLPRPQPRSFSESIKRKKYPQDSDSTEGSGVRRDVVTYYVILYGGARLRKAD